METHAALTTPSIEITALIGTSVPNIILAAEANHQHPL
jgi:hypothetical protein